MLKPGVKVEGLQPEILLGIMIANNVYQEAKQPFVVTSLLDGKHSSKSLHYSGHAADLRTRDLKGITAKEIADQIRGRLTIDYDVVVEDDHIHMEFDKKT